MHESCIRLLLQKCHQGCVKFICVTKINTMWSPGDQVQFTLMNSFMSALAGAYKRHNAIGVAMNNQGWYSHLWQVIAKISDTKGLHSFQGRCQ